MIKTKLLLLQRNKINKYTFYMSNFWVVVSCIKCYFFFFAFPFYILFTRVKWN